MALERVLHSPGELYDLGLVVSNEIKIDDLIKISKESGVRAESFVLSENTPEDIFLGEIEQVFESKKWLITEIKNGCLSSKIYNQLRLLSIQNRMQLFKQDEIKDIKMPKESRIVFLIAKESIFQINNPGFLGLFGPVIKI
jgi:hypothetical protein